MIWTNTISTSTTSRICDRLLRLTTATSTLQIIFVLTKVLFSLRGIIHYKGARRDLIFLVLIFHHPELRVAPANKL